MPGTYDEVLDYLQWPEDVAPEREAVEQALQTMGVEQICDKLETFLEKFQKPPDYPGSGYEWARFEYFNKYVKYWKLNTLIALGIVVEVEPEHVAPARSISEWIANMEIGFGRTGYKDGGACDREEYERRKALASIVPLEWKDRALQYYVGVLSGMIPTGLHGFEVMYVQTMPLRDVPLDPNKWFDNVSAPRPELRPWLQDGSPNPRVHK